MLLKILLFSMFLFTIIPAYALDPNTEYLIDSQEITIIAETNNEGMINSITDLFYNNEALENIEIKKFRNSDNIIRVFGYDNVNPFYLILKFNENDNVDIFLKVWFDSDRIRLVDNGIIENLF